jgi:hypothetical protein
MPPRMRLGANRVGHYGMARLRQGGVGGKQLRASKNRETVSPISGGGMETVIFLGFFCFLARLRRGFGDNHVFFCVAGLVACFMLLVIRL